MYLTLSFPPRFLIVSFTCFIYCKHVNESIHILFLKYRFMLLNLLGEYYYSVTSLCCHIFILFTLSLLLYHLNNIGDMDTKQLIRGLEKLTREIIFGPEALHSSFDDD